MPQLLLPFEFIVVGKPISYQTKNKQVLREWKEQVAKISAEAVKGFAPTGEHVKVVITHYFEADQWETGVPDSDNIVKPVRDALQGIVYVDDYQISDFNSRRRNLNAAFRIKNMSKALAQGFCSGDEFLHFLIESAPDHTLLN
jgi:crossover junction endodeoxyribonuclease RusA